MNKLLVLAAVLLLVGCGTSRPAPRPAVARVAGTDSAVVTWLDEPAAPPAGGPIPRAAARPCDAGDLPATATHAPSLGISQSDSAEILVRNVGPSPCTLSGRSVLLYTDSHGRVRPVPTYPGTAGGDPYGPATIDPGEDAGLAVWFPYACPGATITYGGLILAVAGTHVAVPGLSLAGTCATVHVGNWLPPVDRLAQPTPRFDALTALVDAPATVRPGGPLDYTVVLTNTGSTPLSLDPCPVYNEEFFKNNRWYRLNCAPGSIAAGASVRFAMHIDVLGYTPAGPTRLTWSIAEAAGASAPASALVTVSTG